MKILRDYKNGETFVTLFEDGTKIRDTSQGKNALFPETCDVKITNKCDMGCSYCHEMSVPKGEHGNIDLVIKLFKQLPAGVEIAIGGGNPLEHPDFEKLIYELSKHGTICNVTINEGHFDQYAPLIEKYVKNKWIYGVGYSYTKIPCEWNYENLVSHVIIGITPYKDLEKVTKVNKKVLLLGYKDVGRGINHRKRNDENISNNISSWYRLLPYAVKEAHLSFDNLAIEQLNPIRLFSSVDGYNKFYMGKDGTYSMYLDVVKEEFALASTSFDKHKIGEKTFEEMFRKIKEEIK